MLTIACLHVAFSSVELFESALASTATRGVMMHHVIRPELLANVDLDGAAREVLTLSSEADAVLVTCSTIGSAAEEVAPILSIPVARADRALADVAVREAGASGQIRVLYAAESTVEPTTRLFAESTVGVDVNVELIRVDDAWALFEAGDYEGYARRIAEVADAQPDDAVVALAQASMAPAAALSARSVLEVPTYSVAAILAAMDAGRS